MSKHANHELSAARCPHALADVDLFAPGAQEHWYEAYDILHAEAPVHRLPGEGYEPGTDAFVLSKHEDIAMVVRDEERFPLVASLALRKVIAQGGDPFALPGVTTIAASMVTLRPNPEMWRAHRQELTDPWVGPGASRNEAMVQREANWLVDQWIDRGTVELLPAGGVDLGEARARLEARAARLREEIARARGKLANEGFNKKAPANLVQAERDKLARYESELAELET